MGINRLINFSKRLTTIMTNRHYQAITDKQIVYSINPLIWINYSSTTNYHGCHYFCPL